MIEENPN